MEYLKSDAANTIFSLDEKLQLLEKAAEQIKNKYDSADENEPMPQVLTIQPSVSKSAAKGKPPTRYRNLPDVKKEQEAKQEKQIQPQISLKYMEDHKYFPKIEDDYDRQFYEPQYSCMEGTTIPFSVLQYSEETNKAIENEWSDYMKLYN